MLNFFQSKGQEFEKFSFARKEALEKLSADLTALLESILQGV